MEGNKTKGFTNVFATIVSGVFHPLLIPLYGVLIIFSAPTVMSYLPFTVKRIILTVMAINNVIVPLTLLPWFKYRNIISSWVIEERKERIVPLMACSFFYIVSAFIILRFHIPAFIKSYIVAVTFCAIAVTAITFWWKISIHAVGAGAIILLIITLSFKMQVPLTLLIFSSIFAAGLILAARLWLNTHKPAEVWTGFLLGSVATALILFLI